MNSVLYLAARQQINKLKRTFSRPASAVIWIIVIFFMILGPVMALIAPHKSASYGSVELIVSIIPLFFGIFLMNVFLSQKSGLFTLSDACFLFVAPVRKSCVLAYAILQTAPASLFTAFFLTFYFPMFLGGAIGVGGFFAVLLDMAFLFSSIYLGYYYVYILETAKPGIMKRVKFCLWAAIAVMAVLFLYVAWRHAFHWNTALGAFFQSTLYNALPVFGWTKWGIMSVVYGNYVSGYLPATLLLAVLSAALGYGMLHVKTDFYEQALEDSYRVQKVLDARSGHADQRSVFKVRNTRATVDFGSGAAAIFSKQWLEMKKTSPFVTFRELLIGIIYSVFAYVIGVGFYFAFGMIVFMAVTSSVNDTWHLDFKKPYVYLIPDSSFRKILYSVLAGLIRSLVSGFLSVIVAAVLFKQTPAAAIAFLIIFAGFSVLFVAAEVFTYRIMGGSASVPVLMFLRMLFVMLAAIPTGIILIVLAVILQGHLTAVLAAPVTLLVNLLISGLLLYLSRGLFEQSELMD